MKGDLLEEYEMVLERLENVEWNTEEIIFNVLAIEDKDTLDELMDMTDDELKEILER